MNYFWKASPLGVISGAIIAMQKPSAESADWWVSFITIPIAIMILASVFAWRLDKS